MNKVLIVDTSILCVWLKIPGKDTCGREDDKWNYDRANKKIVEEIKKKSTLVLPLATIIETANHICYIEGGRFQLARNLSSLIKKAADANSPWAAFTDQSVLWDRENLIKMADTCLIWRNQGYHWQTPTIKT
jgi:hypothetical protein